MGRKGEVLGLAITSINGINKQDKEANEKIIICKETNRIDNCMCKKNKLKVRLDREYNI
jgi:hypothetical protein